MKFTFFCQGLPVNRIWDTSHLWTSRTPWKAVALSENDNKVWNHDLWSVGLYFLADNKGQTLCKFWLLHHHVRFLGNDPKLLIFSKMGQHPTLHKTIWLLCGDCSDMLSLISVTSCGLLCLPVLVFLTLSCGDSWKIMCTRDIWQQFNISAKLLFDEIAVINEDQQKHMYSNFQKHCKYAQTEMDTASLM